MPDYDRLRYEELASISELLHGLSNEQWDHDSLCRGWRVRDVVSHIVVGYTTPVALHVGLTRFDGHPRSGDTARKGCPSWRQWETGDEREDRSPTSTRPRWSSFAARAASRSARSPVTSSCERRRCAAGSPRPRSTPAGVLGSRPTSTPSWWRCARKSGCFAKSGTS